MTTTIENELWEEKMFWRDGECFIGYFNHDDSEIKHLRILRLNSDGNLISVDAGFGLVDNDSLWDANTLSVKVNRKKSSSLSVLPSSKESKLIPFRKFATK